MKILRITLLLIMGAFMFVQPVGAITSSTNASSKTIARQSMSGAATNIISGLMLHLTATARLSQQPAARPLSQRPLSDHPTGDASQISLVVCV